MTTKSKKNNFKIKNDSKIKKYLKTTNNNLEKNNKLFNKLSMPLIEASLLQSEGGKLSLDKEYFINLLQKIGNNVLVNYQVTISAEELSD